MDKSQLYKRHLFLDRFGRVVDRDGFIGVDESAMDLEPIYYLCRTSDIEAYARSWDTEIRCPVCGKRCYFRLSYTQRWYGHSANCDTFGHYTQQFCQHVLDFAPDESSRVRAAEWVFVSCGDGERVRVALDTVAMF